MHLVKKISGILKSMPDKVTFEVCGVVTESFHSFHIP